MKRFIIISLLSVITLPMLACLWIDNHNYYLFSAYNHQEFRERVDKISKDNWKAYLGSTEEYYWFNADEVIKAAKQKGDALMVSYVENLQKYLDCVSVEERKQYEWNYPTKEEIDESNSNLLAIRTYAQGKLQSKLRSQHALLLMRCNMMLGNHQANITFWEKTASQFIETVYKDMMKNIYAGALYKSGREAEAGEMFAEMGDYNSLMTQFYKKRSYQAIRQHYTQNPKSKVLPFLVQDFVNNAQEAIDLKHDSFGGKLFIRDLSEQEVWQMRNFCEEVLREGKSDTPILWKTAKAWLEYMFGDKKQATTDILAAAKLDGTERMKECARAIMLYITASQAKDSEAFDNYLADELQWLDEKQNSSDNDGYYYRVKDRLTHQVLNTHYTNRPIIAVALLKALKYYEYEYYIDTMQVSQLEKYLFYTNTPAKTSLDKFLKTRIEKNDTILEDLIGTKYMRLCQWDKAIKWLENIPASYYDQKSYRYYALLRKVEVEPWITRQWLKDEDVEKANKYKWTISEKQKLDFAKDMQMKEATLNVLSGKALEQRCYDLAVRYAQANFTGDCWFLMRDFKSMGDTVRVNEVDLAGKVKEYLQKAAMTNDFALKEKALFALSWRELYREGSWWRENVWDNNASDYVWKINRQSPQYRAFSGLADLEKQNATQTSRYVSRCDEFIQFKKQYR
jgi:hypothetical protein